MSRLRIFGLTAAALAASLSVAAPAAAQDSGSPLSAIGRIFGQKQQTTGQEEEQATTDQVLRIERLEAQIRQMTGQLEQLQYRNQQLENQIRTMGGNPSNMPAAQSQPMRPLPQASPASAPPPPPPPSGRRADVFDPSRNPNAPGAPRALGGGGPVDTTIIAPEPPIGVPGGREAGAPLDLSNAGTPGEPPATGPDGPLPPPPSRNLSGTGAVAALPPPTESAKDSYDLAYAYLTRKDYAQAEDSFRAFLQKYPTDKRVADARFWIGESLFQRQRYEAAGQSFLEFSTKHSGNPKAPEALLRLAQSLGAMKQKEMACATLAEVERKYPKAPAGVKQGVEREQKRVHC